MATCYCWCFYHHFSFSCYVAAAAATAVTTTTSGTAAAVSTLNIILPSKNCILDENFSNLGISGVIIGRMSVAAVFGVDGVP